MGIALTETTRPGETSEDKRNAELVFKLKAWATPARAVVSSFLNQQLYNFAKQNLMDREGFTIQERDAYVYTEAKIWDSTVFVKGPIHTTIAFMVWLERAPKNLGKKYLICFAHSQKAEGE